jgi:hypothetical protein
MTNTAQPADVAAALDTPPPPIQMMGLLAGFQVSQALYVVAEFDIATVLLDGPRSIQELASATQTNVDSLRRLIRFLATVGVFVMNNDSVELTPLGATLAQGTPGSVRNTARFWMETHYAPFAALSHTVRTGETGATTHLGEPFFDWVSKSRHLAELQNGAMGEGAGVREGAFDDYRIPAGEIIADIGGADGTVLSQLLTHEPGRRGIVFDLPSVVAGAPATLTAAGVTDRITTVAGDFFDSVPTADVYVLSVVLHDWDDTSATRILKNIAAAARPGARVVAIEMVLPDDNEPHFAKSLDLVMLAMLGGRERTASDWAALLNNSGFTLDRIIASRTPFSFIEATLR